MKKPKRKKLVRIAVRGCIFSVSEDKARELIETERAYLIREWNRNELAE